MARRGAGPGEFSDNSSIQLHRWTDTLLATDDARVHAYTEALDSARTRPYDLTSGAATGSFAKSLLTLQGRPCYARETEPSRTFRYVPLTADLLEGIVGDSPVVLRDGLPELQRYDQQARVVQVSRRPRTRVRTRDLYPVFVDSSLAGLRRGTDRDDEARYATLFTRDLPLPEFAPQYTALKVDALRRIWVERFRLPGDNGPPFAWRGTGATTRDSAAVARSQPFTVAAAGQECRDEWTERDRRNPGGLYWLAVVV